jgi:hypothetical protein
MVSSSTGLRGLAGLQREACVVPWWCGAISDWPVRIRQGYETQKGARCESMQPLLQEALRTGVSSGGRK